VLLSGGDALLFSDNKLEKILSRLRAIPHIEFLRIGTRVPIFLPQRITPELCQMLQKYHPLWMSVHVNHPRELTTEVKAALEMLANHGIPLGNQSVLLKDVNDNLETMKTLVHKLLMCRVRPYYLYQCDLINGSSHLRASVAKGIEIIEGLRGHTTGYGVPQFVIDAPGGGGKVPINPGYVLYHDNEKIVIRNYEGEIFEYPETGRRPARAIRARARISRRISLLVIAKSLHEVAVHSSISNSSAALPAFLLQSGRRNRVGAFSRRLDVTRRSCRLDDPSTLLSWLSPLQRSPSDLRFFFGRTGSSFECFAADAVQFGVGTLKNISRRRALKPPERK
jgi:hypothetical protein